MRMFLLQSPTFCVTIKHANNQQQGVLFYMNITSKYRSLSVQAKAALWFTICSFLQKGISFITVPIFNASDEHRGVRNLYGLSVLAADFDDYDIAVFI